MATVFMLHSAFTYLLPRNRVMLEGAKSAEPPMNSGSSFAMAFRQSWCIIKQTQMTHVFHVNIFFQTISQHVQSLSFAFSQVSRCPESGDVLPCPCPLGSPVREGTWVLMDVHRNIAVIGIKWNPEIFSKATNSVLENYKTEKKPEYFWPWAGHRTSSQAACGQIQHAWTAQQAQAPSPDTPAIQPKYFKQKASTNWRGIFTNGNSEIFNAT